MKYKTTKSYKRVGGCQLIYALFLYYKHFGQMMCTSNKNDVDNKCWKHHWHLIYYMEEECTWFHTSMSLLHVWNILHAKIALFQ